MKVVEGNSATDAAGIHASLLEVGYAVVRNWLPRSALDAAYRTVLDGLAREGWHAIEDANLDPRFEAAERWNQSVLRVAHREAVLRLVDLPEVTALIRKVLGAPADALPHHVLRVEPTERDHASYGRFTHHDFTYWRIDDMLTMWVPLMPIPRRRGGLAFKPRSHLEPPVNLRLLSAGSAEWETTSYEVGDAVLFHCLTAHAVLANLDIIPRISVDFRWAPRLSSVDETLLERQSKWLVNQRQPFPKAGRMIPAAEARSRSPRSKLIVVHPSWRNWTGPILEASSITGGVTPWP